MKYQSFIFTLMLVTLWQPSFAAQQNNWGGPNCPSSESLSKTLDDTLQKLQPVIGMSLAMTNPKCGNFIYTVGTADISKHLPLNDDMPLPIASNTKPILAVLAFMLMEQNSRSFPQGIHTKLTDILDIQGQKLFSAMGELTFTDGTRINLTDSEFYQQKTGKKFNCDNDTVYRCPELDKVDMHHLLMESSGLADVINENDLTHSGISDVYQTLLMQLFSPANTQPATMLSDVQALKKYGIVQKAKADPIIPAQSHNTDALLLAVILERTSGLTLNELLQQKILIPLGLTTDAMYFHAADHPAISSIRQYVYFNTDAEVENALEAGTTFPILTPALARKLTPSALNKVGRPLLSIPYMQNGALRIRPTLDILDLNTQAFVGFPGPGGVYAQPKAYIRFYQALANGSLLSTKSQQLFNQSFLKLPQPTDYKLSIGYASNSLIEWPAPHQARFLVHQGLVPGGESIVMYNYETGTTIMINTNFGGYVKRLSMPCMQVTTTPYFDYGVMSEVEMKIMRQLLNEL